MGLLDDLLRDQYGPPDPPPEPEGDPVFSVDLIELSEQERYALASFLDETASRAFAGSASASNPVILSLHGLAAAVHEGSMVKLDGKALDKAARQALADVLAVAAQRARGTFHPATAGLEQLSAAVERWAWPGGRPKQKPVRDSDPRWSDGLFRG